MEKPMNKQQFTKRFPETISIAGIAFLIIVFSIITYCQFGAQYFLTWNNFRNILLQSSTVAIVSIGQSILLIEGDFDLSLGRVICLSTAAGALWIKAGMSVGMSVLLMFLIGLAVGMVNGLLVSYIKVPALIATLGTQYICFGLAKLITQAAPISQFPTSLAWIGCGMIFGTIPICVVITLVLFVIVQLLMSGTRIGRNIYAIGGGSKAAYYSGINVKIYRFFSFIAASLLSVLAGIMLMSRLDSYAVTNGQNYEFDAVIAAIIGGMSLTGGQGRIIGALFGTLFLNILFNGFSLLGVDAFVQDVLKGIVLVLAVTFDIVNSNKGK